MDRQISEVAAWAREAASSGDPRILGEFRSKLVACLDIEQPCPQPIFEGMIGLLKSSKLVLYSEYGNLLGDLAICEFAFGDKQRRCLATIIGEVFFRIFEPVGRMQACHLLLSVQPHDTAAEQLLRLLQKSKQENGPQAELIWELAALVTDKGIAPQTRANIEKVLPRRT